MPTPTILLSEAQATTLMGRAESWDCHGRKPLGDCPDKVLKSARGWFKHKIREGPPSTMKDAMKHQVACITVVLDDREANSPQGDLLAGLAARTDDELVAHVQLPDADDGFDF